MKGGGLILAELFTKDSRSGGKSALGARIARPSLRTKGIVAFVILVLYVVLIGVMLAQQRAALRETVEQQLSMSTLEDALTRVNFALAYTILNVHEAYSTPFSRATADTIAVDIEAVQAGLERLGHRYPKVRPWISRLNDSVIMVRTDWGSDSLVDLRDKLHELVVQLDDVTTEVRQRQYALTENFRNVYDSITLTSLIMGLIGVVVLGSVIMLFFSRLVWDIRKLQARAIEVAAGDRGRPLAVTRQDELGALMESVNRMQSELQKHEKQLEVVRQQRFHQEKMAAIGSLAAAIAHEVNNPIAAITGVAEAIQETQVSSACPRESCQPALILEQTRRISQITRQLAEMTAPYSPDPQLLDLNALVRGTCGFIRFDKRFRNIELRLDLDPQLPAINAVADHLTQVLINLLINAADAMVAVSSREPSITVKTRSASGEVVLEVADNGCGMDAQTLARAFNEAFSTKPPGKGSGLGLFMCRSLVEAEGGCIELESTRDRGTRACVRLPSRAARG